jgi:hypothetical protein
MEEAGARTYTEAEVRRMMNRAETIAVESLRLVEKMYLARIKELLPSPETQEDA